MNITPYFKHGLLAVLVALPGLSAAQLRLQSLTGKKTAEISIGATVRIKLPAPGEKIAGCECYGSYKGILKGTEAGKAKLFVQEEMIIYRETNGVFKKVETRYSYPNKEIYTDIDLQTALSLTKYLDPSDGRKSIGALIMGLALLQSFAISPFLSGKARDASDKVVWGGAGIGLIMMILPDKKTWHLQQPEGKNKRLWKFR